MIEDRWFQCTHQYGACAALVVRNGAYGGSDARVIHAAPILRWAIGDTWSHAQQVLTRRRWKWQEMTPQQIGTSL